MIAELLEAHLASPFPAESRGQEVAGVDLILLDADVAGLVSSHLACGGLTESQRLMLDGCVSDADRVLPGLFGEAQRYFARVRELACSVLQSNDDPRAV